MTNDEAQDRETASYAYKLLERLASQAAKSTTLLKQHRSSRIRFAERGNVNADKASLH